MLFAFPSFAEDGSGVSTRGLLFVLMHRGARGGGGQQMWGGGALSTQVMMTKVLRRMMDKTAAHKWDLW